MDLKYVPLFCLFVCAQQQLGKKWKSKKSHVERICLVSTFKRIKRSIALTYKDILTILLERIFFFLEKQMPEISMFQKNQSDLKSTSFFSLPLDFMEMEKSKCTSQRCWSSVSSAL